MQKDMTNKKPAMTQGDRGRDVLVCVSTCALFAGAAWFAGHVFVCKVMALYAAGMVLICIFGSDSTIEWAISIFKWVSLIALMGLVVLVVFIVLMHTPRSPLLFRLR